MTLSVPQSSEFEDEKVKNHHLIVELQCHQGYVFNDWSDTL